MTMHMIRGVREPIAKRKPKKKTAAILALEQSIEDTLKRVGYKGNSKKPRGPYEHDLGVRDRVTSDRIPGNGTKQDDKVYTGNEIGGIAVMHKSNLVPIRKDNKDGFIDVATMRRN